MKKNNREKIKEYIANTIDKITRIVPMITYYSVVYKKEKTNSNGGEFSIAFSPTAFDAIFHIYSNIFKEVTGLSKGEKTYIKESLCHEAGHVYIWEMEGTKRDIEKVATQIGILIFKLLINNNSKGGLK